MSETKPPRMMSAEALEAFAAEIFVGAGVGAEFAKTWAKTLVWANLRGAESHGVLRIPIYVGQLLKGSVKAAPEFQVRENKPAVAILEADRGPGPVIMYRAMDEAIARAKKFGVGWCAARNASHAGAVGIYALRAAEQGMAGVVLMASFPMMAYHGAKVSGVSTNPIAIAFPGKRRAPFLLDMSTANVAMGKILSARDANRAIPTGWGMDAEGLETTDPHKVATLTPLGGPKGSGLSLMFECLCSVAVHNPVISRALEAGDPRAMVTMNGACIALDLDAFGDADDIRTQIDRLGDAILGLPKADGVSTLYLPGERGASVREKRLRDGIPVHAGTWTRLVECAAKVGVKAPA